MYDSEAELGLFLPSSLRFYGGGEIFLIKISKGLINSGFKNTIYENESFTGPFRVDDSFLEKVGIKFQRIKFQKLGKFGQLFFHSMPFKESLSKHSINLIVIWRLPSRKQMKELNCSDSKNIFLMHGIGMDKFRISHPVIGAYQLYMRIQLHLISRLLQRGNNFFQVLNKFQRRKLINAGIPSDRIFLIGNGVEPERYSVGRNDSRFTVLFIGRIENFQKGIKRLIRVSRYVTKNNHDVSFTVIGSGKDSSMLKNIHWLDYIEFVSEERKIKELANANLLLLTSNAEPFSISVLEALFAGLPVISTPVAGPSDILGSSIDWGRISGFSARKIGNDILDYYDQWRSNPGNFFEGKINRSSEAKRIFNTKTSIDKYTEMITRVMAYRP